MNRFIKLLGSLTIAVPLLVAIAVVLAWGTIYETRFGTAAVQRFIYRAWWFQGLLAFLAVNLALAALERYPWKRRHLPFVLAHLGICRQPTRAFSSSSRRILRPRHGCANRMGCFRWRWRAAGSD
jgi:hypothetical protein